MPLSSTSLFCGVAVGLAAIALVGRVLSQRRALRELEHERELAREHEANRRAELESEIAAVQTDRRRWLLAQHWARGGLLSELSEGGWRPICTALAIAASAVQDLDQLEQLLVDHLADAQRRGVEHEVLIWEAAANELHRARRDLGDAIVNPAQWPHPVLAERTRQLLASAVKGAEQALRLARPA